MFASSNDKQGKRRARTNGNNGTGPARSRNHNTTETMNIEELIAANAPNEGGRSNDLCPSHSTMSGVDVWMSHNSKGLSTLFIDGNSTTTRVRLTADELEQLGAMLIAQARWMRETPVAQ